MAGAEARAWSLVSGASPGTASVHAQLRDPGDPSDAYDHAPAHRGDEQRHSKRDGSRHAKELDFNLRRVLEDEDDQQDEEHKCDAGGQPRGAGPSDSWRAAPGRGASLGGRCLGWSLVGSRGGRVCGHECNLPPLRDDWSKGGP